MMDSVRPEEIDALLPTLPSNARALVMALRNERDAAHDAYGKILALCLRISAEIGRLRDDKQPTDAMLYQARQATAAAEDALAGSMLIIKALQPREFP